MTDPQPGDVLTTVAQITHEAMRGYRNTQHQLRPDLSPPDFEWMEPWHAASEAQQHAAREMVKHLIENPERPSVLLTLARDSLQYEYSDVAIVGIVAAEQALKTLGLTIEPMPSQDQTGVIAP